MNTFQLGLQLLNWTQLDLRLMKRNLQSSSTAASVKCGNVYNIPMWQSVLTGEPVEPVEYMDKITIWNKPTDNSLWLTNQLCFTVACWRLLKLEEAKPILQAAPFILNDSIKVWNGLASSLNRGFLSALVVFQCNAAPY